MFEFTQEWAEGMIAEALIARGVPEEEARQMANMDEFLEEIRDDAMSEGFQAGGGGER